MRSWLILPMLAQAAFVPALPADEVEPRPKFTAQFRKKDDRFEAGTEKEAAVWTIASKSGIGGATIDLTSGPAPRRIVIRFSGMRNLESFRLTTGATVLSTHLDRQCKTTLHFDDKGKTGADPKTAAGSLSVELGKEGVEVTLVQSKPGKKWAIDWIDAFRR